MRTIRSTVFDGLAHKRRIDQQQKLGQQQYLQVHDLFPPAPTPILPIDYGKNDGGHAWRFKNESKQLFLSFFDQPDSPRHKQAGVYLSHRREIGGVSTLLLLLDNR